MTIPRFDPRASPAANPANPLIPSLPVSKLADLAVVPIPDSECDARHIAAEPPLPEPGTPERRRLDRKQALTVAGLMGAAMQRPVSWADPAAIPSSGAWCSCCRGRRWWCERIEPKGWRCWTCHPPSSSDVQEKRS